ncbi:MAG: hypothetical protein AUJ37_04185 [Candidatus Magasanikbacteria bacterium CG1_02_41_34]|nr:MAG: hypothetical protein AUJ37_04185 [Candidatus Magasanikbacteria bacterium CG1_02_41_34]
MARRKLQKKTIQPRRIIFGFITASFLLYPIFVLATMYAPGETLNPDCAPGTPSCGVTAPAVSGSNSDITSINGLTTPLSAAQGGTGTSTYAVGDLLFASSTSELGVLHIGTTGKFLKSNGTSIVWDSIPGGDLLAANNLSELTSTSSARSNLGLVIGTNVQAYNTGLSDIAGLSLTSGNFIVSDGANWMVQSSSTVKTTLGLGNVENTALSTWGGTTSITSLGTIATGTWQGTVIASGYLGLNVMLENENISLLTNDTGFVTTTGARDALSSSAIGLSYATSTGVFTLTSGYNIPLTASTTNWNNFYDTPSTAIALGTGLAWNNNTIQAGSGYNIPLTASTTNWNSAYNTVTASSTSWTTAFDWGNHASAGYLTTETDPIWMAASSSYLATTTAASTYLSQVNAVATYLSLADWNTTSTLPASILTSSLTQVGTIATGTWQGTAIASGYLGLNVMLEGENISLLNNNLGFVTTTGARDAISSGALGLTYTTSTGQFTLTSGYNIPLNASTTNWNNFYDTPSTSIALGTGLTWSSNTIQASAGYNIPLTASTTNWNSAYDTVTASSTSWTSAFDWGNHASAGYLVASSNLADIGNSSTARTNLGLGTLAIQDASAVALTGGTLDGIMIGSSNSSTAQFTNVTSTNITYTGSLKSSLTPGSMLFVDANGVLSENNSNFYFDSSGLRLAIGTSTFQSTNPTLEVKGVSELQSRVIAGRDITAAGWQTAYSVWAFSAERAVIAKNNTTGKIGYLAEGGTQGLFMGTAGRSIVFDGRTQAGTTQFDQASGYGTIHLDGVADFNNAAVTYRGFQYNFIDTASAAGSLIMDLQKSGTSQFVVRKDGNVGINTSTPNYKLSIAGISSVASSSLYIYPSTDGTSERAALSLDNWEVGQDYSSNGTKNFYIKDTASSTARFFIDKAGNIGIGTTAPSSSIHLTSGSFTQTIGSNPTIVGSNVDNTNLNGAQGVYVSGDYAYVVNRDDDSLRIIDITSPGTPLIIGGVQSSSTLNGAHDVVVSGKYAYVVNSYDNSLRVIDVSDPWLPSIVGGIKDDTNLSGVRSIYLSGKYAYVVSDTDSSMRIIDISNPTSPFLVGGIQDAVNLSFAYAVAVSGDYAYVVSFDDDSLRVIDVSDPTTPSIVGGVKNASTLNGAQNIYISGKYAYVVNYYDASMRIIDISDPTFPLIVGGIKDATYLAYPTSVYVSGGYAYVNNSLGSTLRIIDVSDPLAATHAVVGSLQNSTLMNGINDIFVSGKYAYVASLTSDSLAIVDLTGIEAPTANIGNILTNNLEVSDSFTVDNDTYLGNGLVVGGRSLFNGAMSIAGGLTLHSNTTSTIGQDALVSLKFDHNTTTMWTMALDKTDNNLYIADTSTNFGVYLTQGSAGGWSTFSDERLKENVMELNVLDRIDNYRAVSFDWKSNGSHDIGAIAQELYKIFPEAVTVGSDVLRDGNRGAWGIQYAKLGALALEGVKELKQELDAYNALILSGNINDFLAQANQNNTLSFAKDVSFTKHVSFGKDTVGSTLIQAGEDGVRVAFDQPYDTPPIVNLTLASDATLDTYFVDSVDTESFTIRIRPSVSQDIMVNWSAFGQVSMDTVAPSSAPTVINASGQTGTEDSLTDIANNYLTDHGLTVDGTTTSSTASIGNTTTNTSSTVENNATSTPEPVSTPVVDPPPTQTEDVIPIVPPSSTTSSP